MHWESVIALVLVIPIILFPAAFVWFLNVSGIYTVIRERQVARKKGMRVAAEVK